MPLDELVSGPVDFIKIDVEGMEMQALAGAAGLSQRNDPLLYIEVVDETVAEFMALGRRERLSRRKALSRQDTLQLPSRPKREKRGSAGMSVRTMLQVWSCSLAFGAALAHSSASAARRARAWWSRRSSPQPWLRGTAAGRRTHARTSRRSSSYAGTEKKPGRYGGTLRILGGSAKDTRLMVIYGYARLVGYTPDFEIAPDIAESVDVEENRVFTFHLRPGHRWSDGEPFTSEDFRFYWEDIANDAEVSRFGPPKELLVDGEKPVVEFPDEVTVRYTWSKPNSFFPAGACRGAASRDLPPLALPEAIPRETCRARGGDEDGRGGGRAELGRAPLQQGSLLSERQSRLSDPAALGAEDAAAFRPLSCSSAIPTTTASTRRGMQLPYIDEVAITVASSDLIPAKVAAGEADLQGAYLSFSNFTFLKEAEERSGYKVRRWLGTKGARVALFPDLNTNDPACASSSATPTSAARSRWRSTATTSTTPSSTASRIRRTIRCCRSRRSSRTSTRRSGRSTIPTSPTSFSTVSA